MKELEGKTALVTGAAQGIGYAIAERLVRAGAKVSVSDIRQEAVEQAAQAICEKTGAQYGEDVTAEKVDVSHSRDIAGWIDKVVRKWNTLDIFVNNAGIQLNRASTDITDEEWRQVMGIDLDGVFYCSREAGKVMLRQGKGSIISISSIANTFGLPRRLPYGVAKSGVAALTRVLAAEWAAQGVRVNAIAPGYVETELVSFAFSQGHIQREDIVSKIPMNHLASPDQIAEVALFLASERANYITGQVVYVDGGYSITK